jgi:fructose-1,6-bisphosphatase/inositol monophosphatase family enzyme
MTIPHITDEEVGACLDFQSVMRTLDIASGALDPGSTVFRSVGVKLADVAAACLLLARVAGIGADPGRDVQS